VKKGKLPYGFRSDAEQRYEYEMRKYVFLAERREIEIRIKQGKI
jgi:hypothetical protein